MGIREAYRELEEQEETRRRVEILRLFAEESQPPFTVCDDPRTVFYSEPARCDRSWDEYEGIPLDEELPRTE